MSPLPPPLKAFFDADRADDAAALVACFSPEGVVLDEGRRHQGSVAIAAWIRGAKAKYRYAAEALASEAFDSSIDVRVRLVGAFLGSPLELTYSFVLADTKILSLEIHS